MRFISTKTHGYIDYLMGLLQMVVPWFIGPGVSRIETWVPVILGLVIILYSLMTNYELGIAHMITMKTHLMFDLVAGAGLAVSPWLFGFNDNVWLPYVLVGVLEILVTLMTKTRSGAANRGNKEQYVAMS